ncbi:hypothetical protein ACJX0J_011656, partial [Zea mays]
ETKTCDIIHTSSHIYTQKRVVRKIKDQDLYNNGWKEEMKRILRRGIVLLFKIDFLVVLSLSDLPQLKKVHIVNPNSNLNN